MSCFSPTNPWLRMCCQRLVSFGQFMWKSWHSKVKKASSLKNGQKWFTNCIQNIKHVWVSILIWKQHLGDNCIQNFHLGRYILRYTVGNLVLRRRVSGAVKRDFPAYIRQYTSPNENFEYGYPHSNALLTFSLQKVSENVLCCAYMSSDCQLHETACQLHIFTCQPMKSAVT